jgi:cytosine/adenosine deaminase-related metal-dependent hydrolase
MRRVRETTDLATYREAARAGLREAWRHGTTTVADTGVSGAAAEVLSEGGGRGIYYQEVLGPDPAQADSAMAQLAAAVRVLRRTVTPAVTLGVSPHAPHTVHPGLLRRALHFARARGMPLAGHLAESEAEQSFVTAQDGPFADGWRDRTIALPPPARSPVAAWEAAGVLGSDFLAIHLVRADEWDVALVAGSGTAVALCPRSNARHGHGAPPVTALLEAGIRVGLGTDSVASVDFLDLLAEARAFHQAACDAERVVRILTIGGAAAIGLDGVVGSLEVGKWADLCLLRVPKLVTDPGVLAAAVLAGQPSDVLATYVAGRPVYRAGGEP